MSENRPDRFDMGNGLYAVDSSSSPDRDQNMSDRSDHVFREVQESYDPDAVEIVDSQDDRPCAAPWHSLRYRVLLFVERCSVHVDDALPDDQRLHDGLLAAYEDGDLRIKDSGFLEITQQGAEKMFQEVRTYEHPGDRGIFS